MKKRLYPRDDFEATVVIYSEAEGGRRTPVRNGIRWDLAYADDDPADTNYMIWPDFFSYLDGSPLPADSLPIGVPLVGRFVILNDDIRRDVHQARISVGTRFYCRTGSRRVAAGTVTRVTGLHDPIST